MERLLTHLRRKSRKGLPFLLIGGVFTAFAADTWYVKRDGGADVEGGGSATAPFQSIQYAVDRAKSGDTVLVAPGIYDNGSRLDANGVNNRVCIEGKSLTVKATGKKSDTVILGKFDPDSESGIGDAAMRCIRIDANDNTPVVISGFTITGGACKTTDNNSTGYAGGIMAGSPRTFIVDCVISNCVGARGGASYSGTLVRCLITGNRSTTKAAVNYRGCLVNCVVTHNRVKGNAVNQSTCVNCTFDDNSGIVAAEKGCVLLNCASVNSGGRIGDTTNTSEGNVTASNCVFNAGAAVYSGSGDDVKWSVKSMHGCMTDAARMQYVAPMFNDFRPLPGSDLLGAGDASHFAVLSEPCEGVDYFIDYLGTEIPDTGAITAGAVQAPCEPQGGLVVFQDPVIIDGAAEGICGMNYAYAGGDCEQWRIRAPESDDGMPLFSFGMYGLGDHGSVRYPAMDDSLWIMAPSKGLVLTNECRYADQVLYVHPSLGNDETGDGTEDNPYRTIQAAHDSSSGSRTVIRAAEGEYTEGSKEAGGFTNRVAVTRNVRVIGAGAGKSVIRGALDTTSDDRHEDGRGAHALRCLYISSGCVQGFTLADGRSAYDNGTTVEKAWTRGGCVLAASDGTVADCIITNGAAYRGGGMMYGRAYRCRMTDCTAGNGVTRYTSLYSCVFDNMERSAAAIVGSNTKAYGCTARGASSSVWAAGTGANSIITRNDASPESGTVDMGTDLGGNVWWKYVASRDGHDSTFKADPLLMSDSGGDLRILSCSPAIGCGVTDGLWQFYCSDMDNRPLLFVNGRPTAGAYQVPVQAVIAAAPPFGEVDGSGTNVVEEGESITVTANDTGRNAIDLLVDGESVGGTSWTYTAPAGGVPFAPIMVEAVYSTNWYVNAVSGNDNNDGFTPESAKLTFESLFEEAVMSGDCVHAAAGAYNSGSMPCGASVYVRSRLAIPEGVSVVADEGPESTFIVGADATTSPVDFKGRGTNSVRCVYMGEESRLSGFTLTGGRTCGDGSSNNDNFGGGVFAVSDSALVENCIISNNASSRAGGVHHGQYVNCRLFDNWAVANRAAASQAYLYNCIIDRCRGDSALQNCYAIINCTIGSDSMTEDETVETAMIALPEGPIRNCLIMGNYNGSSGSRFIAENCVITREKIGLVYEYSNCVFATEAELELDSDYRPLSRTSAVVDAGSNIWVKTAVDVFGTQRIYNGTVDAGAVEFDWRGRYAEILGVPSLSVESASADVRENEGKVRIPAGAVLEASWKRTFSGNSPTVYTMNAQNDGQSSLAVELNGSPYGELDNGGLTFSNREITNAIVFACTGEEDGWVDIYGFRQKSNAFTVVFR